MTEFKEERKRKKSAAKESKSAAAAATAAARDGYETDAGSTAARTRTKLRKKHRAPTANNNSGGYETDDGYVSSSNTKSVKKSRSFFRLGNRSKTNVDDREEQEIPPPPPVPPPVQFRLPIAERFATTLKFDLDETSSATLLDPPPPVLPAISASPTTTPTSDSLPTPRDTDRDSIEAPESSVAHDSSAFSASTTSRSYSRRTRGGGAYVVSSDSSDHHGSSAGHSIFSKITGSSSSSSTMSHHNTQSKKAPVISYPLTRSPSPPSPPVPLMPTYPYTASPKKQMPEPLTINTDTDSSSSRLRNRFINRQEIIYKTPDHPPPKPTIIIPPYAHQDSDETVKQQQQPELSSSSIVPSTEFIVPSPRYPASPSSGGGGYSRPPKSPKLVPPSTHIFANHDIPPPSPPPAAAPLPEIPEGGGGGGEYFAQQQQKLTVPQQSVPLTRTRSISPSPGKRGVESPFPAPNPNRAAIVGGAASTFESRVKIPRYRELYALPLPAENSISISTSRSASPNPSAPRVTFEDEEEDDDDDDDEELQNVLARFKAHDEERYRAQNGGSALGRMRSIEASAPTSSRRQARFVEPEPEPPVDTLEEGEDDDDRSYYSRPSTNERPAGDQHLLYPPEWNNSFASDAESRTSIMDPQKSEEARTRFLKRIDAMFDKDGRELPGHIEGVPPVPRIPVGLAAGEDKRRQGWF